MTKSASSNSWLEEVEAVEERLEVMKLTAWRLPKSSRSLPPSAVRLTAGLLANRVPPGPVYERRLRRAWERATRRRAS